MSEGRRILVIDDSMTVRKLVEIALRGTAHTVEFAATGSEGLTRARDTRPDVILLDYLLPDLKGTEICKRLAQDLGTAEVPVVMMSANSHKLMAEFRQFPTVVDFVGKPFTAEGIRARLDRAGARLAVGSGSGVVDVSSSGDTTRPASASGLELRGEVSSTPVREVVRLLAASKATGSLVVHHTARSIVWLRRGEILLATTTTTTTTTTTDAEKPEAISLAEAGSRPVSTLPLELLAASKRAVAEMFELGRGTFVWLPAVTVPDYVEAFGRSMSLASIELSSKRELLASEEATKVLALSFDRTPKFSEKLAGATLDVDERKLLALVDGRPGHDLVTRSRLAPVQVASILERLRAADLIVHDLKSTLGVRTLGVCLESDPSLVADLRAALRRHAGALEIVEIASGATLAASIARVRADLLLVDAAIFTPEVGTRELAALQRDGGVPIVALLPGPMTPADAWLRAAGLHGVLCQPLHISELVRLVFL